MPTFRKKPVEIEAFQMTREARASNANWPAWAHEAWNKDRSEPGALFPSNYPNSDGADELAIMTLEGVHRVSFNDWIIRGVKGELYPCKPEIFAATYDTVAAAAPQAKPPESADLPPRVSRIQRLMTDLETWPSLGDSRDPLVADTVAQIMVEARRLILDLLHMSDKPIGESIYAACMKEAEKYDNSTGSIEDLATATKFAKRWLPECFEASPQGQVHFARAVVESVISASEAYLKTLNLPAEA